jgi:tRNA nucleotidyltransferase (CCA-adding enzyme)
MISKIPKEVIEIYQKLRKEGFEVYFVGGCVRSLLLDVPVKDWDLTTSAKPDEIQKVFDNSFYDNKFGTVGIPYLLKGQKKVVEITTYRTEKSTTPTHHPESVEWGKTLEEDLSRRDFTINAIALSITDDKDKLVDPFGGEKDLKGKTVKAVGDPNQRFKEDALRLMRAIRIATELQFKIEDKTWEAIKKDAKLLDHISKERVRDELLRILKSEYAYEGVMLLHNSGLLKYIIPELLEGVGISQKRPGRHHTEDVFTHNVLSLKFTPSKDPIVKLAALIHDIGKPSVAAKDEKGLVIFYNHEVSGAKIAKDIAERLRLSNKDKEKIVTLVRWHMFSVSEFLTDAAVRRFIRRIGTENVGDMMDLRIGDRLGGGTQTAESWRLKKFKEKVAGELAPKPFSINDLVVDGKDVMRILNIKPGPKIGEILEKLFAEVDENLELNSKEYLEKRIKELG